jgi:glycine/D-amino acid oxidase-like deaminating enzyme
MKLRQAPYWLDRLPTSHRPSFPRLRTALDTRVVIIGGGLTGAAAAFVLASARIPVVLIEAETVCGGATAGAIGLIREDPDAAFTATASLHGLRSAREVWQGVRRASLELTATLRRLRVRCDLAPHDLVSLAGPDQNALRGLRREFDSRRDAGLDHRWIAAAALRRDTAVDRGGAIKTSAYAVDPVRAGLGLIAAAAARGAQVFQRSPAVKLRNRERRIEVVTAGGSVSAEFAIIAGAGSLRELQPLRRHLHPRDGYGVVTGVLPAAVRREAGSRRNALRLDEGAARYVRWLADGRVLVAGADQPAVPARLRDRAVIQRTGQLMYELSLLYPAISGTPAEWGWSSGFDDTVDGLPYIGTHRNFPRHLFALGLGRHGAAMSWLAARILLRHLAGEPAKADQQFSFGRILH